MSVVCGKESQRRGVIGNAFLPADKNALLQLNYWSRSPAGTLLCPPSRNEPPRRGRKPPHPSAAQAHSLSRPGKLGERGGAWGKQLKESGPAVLDSRVGVVPLDAERFAPVGRLQQVKFQHERGVQGAPQEGVIAEHRHAHDGGVHHRILGEPARSNRALPSPCLAVASLRGLPGHPALTS